ncbi:MAG: DUF1302 domain-containing protein [Kangiellaceae bacterium]|jgi:hypothetical protein|nr:DUF1302 domain-containing protein [Kangiellaceae bacterium]
MLKKELNKSAQPSSSKWTKLASAVTIALAVPAANAVDIDWGDWSGSFDTTLIVGSSWRVENQDARIIGRGKPIDNGGVGSAFSHNGDDGNLNFHKGDAFSQTIRGAHEFALDHKDGYGVFARAIWFYDHKLENGNFRYYGTQDTPQPARPGGWDPRAQGFNQSSLDINGTDTRVLDFFVHKTWDFEESTLQVRLGEQVINWGESTFIQHSISEANAIDVTRLRTPGAELREAFLPSQTLWASWDVTETITLEGYVQFDWNPVIVDEPGTYFATQDFLGQAGENIWLGFAAAPEFTPGTAAFRLPDRRARDDGQFGIKLAYYDDELGDTEFGFYYLNYHNKRPVISGVAFDLNANLNGMPTPGTTGFTEYIEDIQLYGISFNTATDGGLSIAGEISYRVDEPLQVDDVELLFATLEGVAIPRGTSQLNVSAQPGEYISGYRLFDTVQGQVTFTNLFGPGLGAFQWVGLIEVGFNQIEDLPSQDDLRFEVAGTFRSGNPDRAAFEGVETNGFADEFSWGYRAVLRADYLGVIGAWNMSPRLVYQHDVEGNTPAPISNFIEDRKALAVGARFDYQQTWVIDFAYNQYFGAGTQNLISDRDFVSLTASYAF